MLSDCENIIDKIDKDILNILRQNSKISYKDIGKKLFLTGQSIGQRVTRMEKEGIIKKYTIITDDKIYDKYMHAYITAFMKDNNHHDFLKLIKNSTIVIDAHKVSGEGCYILEVKTQSKEEINSFLDKLLRYCNYKLSISVEKVK